MEHVAGTQGKRFPSFLPSEWLWVKQYWILFIKVLNFHLWKQSLNEKRSELTVKMKHEESNPQK